MTERLHKIVQIIECLRKVSEQSKLKEIQDLIEEEAAKNMELQIKELSLIAKKKGFRTHAGASDDPTESSISIFTANGDQIEIFVDVVVTVKSNGNLLSDSD